MIPRKIDIPDWLRKNRAYMNGLNKDQRAFAYYLLKNGIDPIASGVIQASGKEAEDAIFALHMDDVRATESRMQARKDFEASFAKSFREKLGTPEAPTLLVTVGITSYTCHREDLKVTGKSCGGSIDVWDGIVRYMTDMAAEPVFGEDSHKKLFDVLKGPGTRYTEFGCRCRRCGRATMVGYDFLKKDGGAAK